MKQAFKTAFNENIFSYLIACDCDPTGSLDEGICDSRTDEANGLVSGQCHCKENVDGRRCDTCKNGFWNLTDINPSGCIGELKLFVKLFFLVKLQFLLRPF